LFYSPSLASCCQRLTPLAQINMGIRPQPIDLTMYELIIVIIIIIIIIIGRTY